MTPTLIVLLVYVIPVITSFITVIHDASDAEHITINGVIMAILVIFLPFLNIMWTILRIHDIYGNTVIWKRND